MTSNNESNKTFLLSFFVSILTSEILGHFYTTVTLRNGTIAKMCSGFALLQQGRCF